MSKIVLIQLILMFLSGAGILSLSAFVYFKSRHNLTNITYSLAALFAGCWVLSHALIVLDSVYRFADPTLLGRMTFIFTLVLPSWLLFTEVFPRQTRPIKPFFLFVLYFPTFIAIAFSFTPYMVKRLVHKGEGWTDWDIGWGYIPFALLSFVYFSWSIYNIIKSYVRSKGVIRLQVKYVMLGGCITSIVVFICNILSVALFDYDRLVPYGAVSILVLVVTTAYAILRYRLMNIELIINRTAFFIITLGLIFAFHIGFVALIQAKAGYFVSSALSIVLLIFIFSFTPLRGQIQKFVDSIVYRGRYDYQKVLREASKALVTMLDLDQLLSYFIKIIVENIGVKKASLFLVEEEKSSYKINASYGLPEDIERSYEFADKNGIVKWLRENKTVFVKEEMERKLKEAEFSKIYSDMDKLGAQLTMPIFYKNRLMGLLNLDYKETGDIYTQEDLQVLDTIASEAAIAIENARLYREAITDGLTRLYHHKYFQMRLTEEMERSKRYKHPVSLMMIDIDYFKNFNDKYGHQAGDFILKDVAKNLKTYTRITDIVARYGGEEFAVILTETPDKGAMTTAERLRMHVESSHRRAEDLRRIIEGRKILYGEKNVGVTISVGISTYDGTDRNFTSEQFIGKSDAALYKAKESGRNRVEIG